MNSESKFCENRFCSNFDSNNILRSDFAHVASTLLPHCTRPCAKLWPYFYVRIKCKGLLTSLLWNDSLTALDMLHSGWYRGTAGRIVFPSFSHFGCPKPVFPRTVFTGKYHGKNRVLSKTLQPWCCLINEKTNLKFHIKKEKSENHVYFSALCTLSVDKAICKHILSTLMFTPKA